MKRRGSCFGSGKMFAYFGLLFGHFLLLTDLSSSLPLCTDLRAPFVQRTHLAFCPDDDGKVCCNAAKDLQLQKQFEAMNISDSACASMMKSILCAICDQFSAELYKVESGPRQVPVLCNPSTAPVNSTLSNKSISSFCSTVWDTCQNVPILNSPFITSTSSKLNQLWKSKGLFCDAFGGSSDDGSMCFDGQPVSLSNTETNLVLPKGMCLEKIGNGSYLNMVAHPDKSNRAFFSEQSGKIWLATVPEQGSGGTLGIDQFGPFVDLTDEVYFENSFGLMGLAFHPNFAHNGRFFASFNCDKSKTPGCSGRCACNTDVNCVPSLMSSENAAQLCRYHKVIAEFSVNGTAPDPSLEKSAKPLEVRRIFTMGLPLPFNHGGQILFGPTDGYLYVMVGDAGIGGDPYNFAQNKKSLLGKILRLDIDNIPGKEEEIGDFSLWGSYSVPQDNPYAEDKELQPEIWAVGLRNPWRCSFDSERPMYFICADTGQDRYEEVNMITKGGNYGWSVYEGPFPFKPWQSPDTNNSDSMRLIFPVLGYNHSDARKTLASAAISGGYFYRSTTDPCMFGSYLYADLYGSSVWAAAEIPKDSGNFTSTSIPFTCAHDSPINCNYEPGSDQAALGYIYSFGEDNGKDIFLLASTGVYRVVAPSRCNYTCSKENVTDTLSSPSPSSSYRKQFIALHYQALLLFTFSSFLVLCHPNFSFLLLHTLQCI